MPASSGLLEHFAGALLRFETDFTKGRFVLLNILLQDVEQSFRLLRAQVDTLETLDVEHFGRGLVDGAEEEEEIPDVHANLNTVGITLAVVGRRRQLNFRLRRRCHDPSIHETTRKALAGRIKECEGLCPGYTARRPLDTASLA